MGEYLYAFCDCGFEPGAKCANADSSVDVALGGFVANSPRYLDAVPVVDHMTIKLIELLRKTSQANSHGSCPLDRDFFGLRYAMTEAFRSISSLSHYVAAVESQVLHISSGLCSVAPYSFGNPFAYASQFDNPKKKLGDSTLWLPNRVTYMLGGGSG